MKYLHPQCFFFLFPGDLQKLRVHLSKSLEPDILLVNAAWESIVIFHKELQLKFFENSLSFCSRIGNALLRQGVLSMIWHNFICKKVAALTNLIEKVFFGIVYQAFI